MCNEWYNTYPTHKCVWSVQDITAQVVVVYEADLQICRKYFDAKSLIMMMTMSKDVMQFNQSTLLLCKIFVTNEIWGGVGGE